MKWGVCRSSLSVRFAAALIPLAAVVATVVTVATVAQPADSATSLRARVEAYEEAWNTHDSSELAGFFAPDADMIMGNGPRVVGRDAIRDSWGGYFDRIVEQRKGTFAIESLRLMGDNAALLNIASTTAGRAADGRELPTRRARGTWVVVREDGEWLILAMRGLPAEGEARLSAGTDK